MNTRTKALRVSAIVLSLATLLSAAGSASAETWNHRHPRRAEVNARLDNQNRRISDQRREGKLSAWQARRLHAEDRTIRREERFMAAQNHGHITRAEQRALNQQENRVSGQIGR
jgi:hypothetical protein